MINYSSTRDELEKIALDPLSLGSLLLKSKGGLSTALTGARILLEKGKWTGQKAKELGEHLAKRVSQSGMRRADPRKLTLGKIVGKPLKELARVAEPAAVEYGEFTHALGRALGPKAGPAIRRATQTGLKYGPKMTEAVAGKGARRKIEQAIGAVPKPLQRIVSQEYTPLPSVAKKQVERGAKGVGSVLKRMFLTTPSGQPVGALKRSK